jgi:hypothetical protein
MVPVTDYPAQRGGRTPEEVKEGYRYSVPEGLDLQRVKVSELAVAQVQAVERLLQHVRECGSIHWETLDRYMAVGFWAAFKPRDRRKVRKMLVSKSYLHATPSPAGVPNGE